MATEQTSSPSDPDTSPHGPCRDFFDRADPPVLVDHYRAGTSRLDMRVVELTDADLDRAFDPPAGRWSCRTLLTHLMDTEMLFTMRLRRMLAEDNPVFEPWDEHAFLNSRFCRPGADSLLMPAGALLASVYTTRQTTATWLVQLSPDDWDRRALTPVNGEATTRAIVAYACWHLEHHASYLGAKLDTLLGPAPDRPAGGCGAGCGCGHDH